MYQAGPIQCKPHSKRLAYYRFGPLYFSSIGKVENFLLNLSKVILNLRGTIITIEVFYSHGNQRTRKAMNRNRSNQKANPALKTKTGNKKKILQIDKIQ